MDRRGLSKLILQLLVKFNPPGMHYSFGDREGRMLPHIVLPLWRAVDVAVTMVQRVSVVRLVPMICQQ